MVPLAVVKAMTHNKQNAVTDTLETVRVAQISQPLKPFRPFLIGIALLHGLRKIVLQVS